MSCVKPVPYIKKENPNTLIWRNSRGCHFQHMHLSRSVKLFCPAMVNTYRTKFVDENIGKMSRLGALCNEEITNKGKRVIIRPEVQNVKYHDGDLVIVATPIKDKIGQVLHKIVYVYEMFDDYNETNITGGLLDRKFSTSLTAKGSFISIHGDFIIAQTYDTRCIYICGYLDIEEQTITCENYVGAVASEVIKLRNNIPELTSDDLNFVSSSTNTSWTFKFKIPTGYLNLTKSRKVILKCEFPKKPKDTGSFAIIGTLRNNQISKKSD